MYSYSWDNQSGGFVLNSTPLKNSQEPRPVYWQELDLLGFDKYYNYEHVDIPICWAESNRYIYRGKNIAKITGGGVYTAPSLEIYEYYPQGTKKDKNFLGIAVDKLSLEKQKEFVGYVFDPASFDKSQANPLVPVDIQLFVAQNKKIMDALVNTTLKGLYNTYQKYKEQVDIFQVAFSGGKDSIVMLDLVKKVIPKKDFVVVFGDTQMEFPDTYDLVKKVQAQMQQEQITFLTARSNLEVMDSWQKFGPPSNTIRWCCSVHKTTPQLLKLRQHFAKDDIINMSFVGVRRDESQIRSEYEEVAIGKKVRDQFAGRPILKWSSAEVWLYHYYASLNINEAYKKGNSRAGCLVCPMAKGTGEYIRRSAYTSCVDKFVDKIVQTYNIDTTNRDEFVDNGFWRHRASGKMLKQKQVMFSNHTGKELTTLHLSKPTTNWKEWIKTLGELSQKKDKYNIRGKDIDLDFEVKMIDKGMEVSYATEFKLSKPTQNKLFRQVFIKAISCSFCKTCEANCPNNKISFEKDDVKIKDCSNCHLCHTIPDGCLSYQSLKTPQGDGKMSSSISQYSTHVPKKKWIYQFVDDDNYVADNPDKLSSKKLSIFKTFLRHAGLLDKQGTTLFQKKIKGLTPFVIDGLILANMAYSTQIRWYLENMHGYVSKENLQTKLEFLGVSSATIGNARQEFPQLVGLFQDVGLGTVERTQNKKGEKGNLVGISRGTWNNPNPLVILYSLYKMAEANDLYQYSIERLMDFEIGSQGISPAQIFGLDKETMSQLLRGLRTSNGDFVSYSESLGLSTLDLKRDKSSQAVLELF